MAVYLIHIEPRYKHARHYLGFSDDVQARYERHLSGCGSPLLKAAVAAGCELHLVRVWEDGDRNFERRLKNRKNTPRLCPICNRRSYDKNATEVGTNGSTSDAKEPE